MAQTAKRQTGANLSKAEELDMLRKLRERAGESSYLASFLSEEALKWFANQMTDDMSCDVLDALRYEREQRNVAEARAQAAEKALATVSDSNARHVERLTKDFDAKRAELLRLTERAESRLADEQRSYSESVERVMRLSGQLDAARTGLVERSAEVDRLKVMMFDMRERHERELDALRAEVASKDAQIASLRTLAQPDMSADEARQYVRVNDVAAFVLNDLGMSEPTPDEVAEAFAAQERNGRDWENEAVPALDDIPASEPTTHEDYPGQYVTGPIDFDKLAVDDDEPADNYREPSN